MVSPGFVAATAINTVAPIGYAYIGAKHWKARPVIGGLLGFFVVGAISNRITTAIVAPNYRAEMEQVFK